jgi:hypothetical protein
LLGIPMDIVGYLVAVGAGCKGFLGNPDGDSQIWLAATERRGDT